MISKERVEHHSIFLSVVVLPAYLTLFGLSTTADAWVGTPFRGNMTIFLPTPLLASIILVIAQFYLLRRFRYDDREVWGIPRRWLTVGLWGVGIAALLVSLFYLLTWFFSLGAFTVVAVLAVGAALYKKWPRRRLSPMQRVAAAPAPEVVVEPTPVEPTPAVPVNISMSPDQAASDQATSDQAVWAVAPGTRCILVDPPRRNRILDF